METVDSIEQVSAAYLTLTDAMTTLSQHIRADGEAHWPIYVPQAQCSEGEDPREAAIQSIARVRVLPSLIKTGILCCSTATRDAALALNQAKDQFKAAVGAIQSRAKKSATAIQMLIRQDTHEARDPLLRKALRAIGAQSFDLRCAYAKVQILPTHTRSVSWTWAMKHRRIKKYTLAEAYELASQLTDEKAQLAAIIQLKKLPQHEILLQKVDLSPQLRANIQYLGEGENEGSHIKKSIAVSGVLFVPQKTLPITLWRDCPLSESLRLARPQKREDTLFIPTLNMYRYIDHD